MRDVDGSEARKWKNCFNWFVVLSEYDAALFFEKRAFGLLIPHGRGPSADGTERVCIVSQVGSCGEG